MSDLVLHRGIGPATSCKSCGVRIVFARTISGKTGPFQEDENGLWVLVNGAAKYVGPGPIAPKHGIAECATRYSSHFASCPQHATWRSRTRTDD